MKTTTTVLLRAALTLLFVALPLTVFAQQEVPLQYFRPLDQRGVDIFEPPKQDTVGYDGFELYWGAAFTQQLQGLSQDTETTLVDEDGNAVTLPELGTGFNLATANLYLGAQLADGIRVNLTTYLSSRHHPEAWVKGGYIQVDKLPMLNSPGIDNLMNYVTLKVGHFEINYGDGHFRRTDNGNALYNPFVGNYVVDAFTTEIGGEVYVQNKGFLGMVGITGGEIKGAVTNPDDRAPSFYGKVGIDRQINDALRVRLTGSAYTTSASLNNTLHNGDRAGSRYYAVFTGSDWSGRVRPGIRNEKTAFMVNPFVQFGGFEVFGLLEWVEGNSSEDAPTRSWNQYAVEVLYRFLDDDVYVGGRYNVADGELFTNDVEVSVDRIQIGGGWFATPNILLKAEYVQQNYNDYPAATLFHEGSFDGFMIEGVLTF
jgi:hypothetical protein